MAYSVDFRKRAIEFMDEGHTYKQLYETFKIYPSTIEAWRKLLEKTGSVEPQYDKRDSSRKIDLSKLEQAIEEKPDAYLDELAKQFACTKQAIFYAQKRLKISYKKTLTYAEKCRIARFFYVFTLIFLVTFFVISDIIYVDESGINRHYQREYARAKRGVRVYGTQSEKRLNRTNIIAGLWYGLFGKKHVAVQSYTHPTNSTFFEDWFEWDLLAQIPQNSLIIMDNASFHRKNRLYEIAARHGVFILFLPPYSPDLNPIEKSWANFKRCLCDNSRHFPNIEWAIMCYFKA